MARQVFFGLPPRAHNWGAHEVGGGADWGRASVGWRLEQLTKLPGESDLGLCWFPGRWAWTNTDIEHQAGHWEEAGVLSQWPLLSRTLVDSGTRQSGLSGWDTR